jgi:hypothetical protein
MKSDEEPNLKAAFVELHRRKREYAPPFAFMREHAMRQANDRQHPSWKRLVVVRRIAWTTAAVCGVAIAMWWIGQLPEPASRMPIQAGATERVDELIAAIEQHLELNDPASGFEYPTDLLLAENLTDFSP